MLPMCVCGSASLPHAAIGHCDAVLASHSLFTTSLALIQMMCPSGAGFLTSLDQLCDGQRDCDDGSDEVASFCASFNCTAVGRVSHARGEERLTTALHCIVLCCSPV